MGTIATTTNGSPFIYPNYKFMDRDPVTGNLWAMVKSSTANTYSLYRSTNNGGVWSLRDNLVRANIQEIGGIHIGKVNWLHWCYRTNESGQDRIFYRRFRFDTEQWEGEILTGFPVNNGVAGSAHQGLDLMVAISSYKTEKVCIATGYTGGASGNVRSLALYGLYTPYAGQTVYNNSILSGRRIWPDVGSGRIGPSIDMEHNGDGKTSHSPNLWISWGRTSVQMVKLAWNGSGWTTPDYPVTLSTSVPAQDYIPAKWDGKRWITSSISTSTADTINLYERNKANTTTIVYTSPAHAAGNIRAHTFNFNKTTGDIRVYAVGTSNADLYYIDWVRATATWTSWTTVSTTDIIGTPPQNFGVRLSTHGTGKHDVYTAHATPSPNTLLSTHQSLVFAPLTPTWEYDAVHWGTGDAVDVEVLGPPTGLFPDWTFNSTDPSDVQTAFAMSRQIGTGALEYWRVSDGTWQATEQKNSTGSTSLTMPIGFVDRFTNGVDGAWGPSGGSVAYSTAQGRSTGTSAAMTTSGSPTTTEIRQTQFVTGSQSYSLEAWGLSVAGYGNFACSINWFDGGLGFLSTSTSGGSALAAGVWGRRSVTAVAPPTAAFASIGVIVGSSPPNGTVVYVDDVTLGVTPTPWAAHDDPPHTYKVKTWNAADVASGYSEPLVVVPSKKVNPTITSPSDGGTVTSDRVTVTWTSAEQTAWRVETLIFGQPLQDSGKVAGTATSYESPEVLINGFNYSVRLTTWNNEGLPSTSDTNNFAVAFIEPAQPQVRASPNPLGGTIRVTVVNPTPAFLGVGAAVHGNNASVVPPIPTPATPLIPGAKQLLLVLAAIRNSGTGTVDLPADWTSLVNFGNMRLMGRYYDVGTVAPTITFTGGAANATTSAQMAAFWGFAPFTIGTPATQLNGSAQNIAVPAFTVTTDGLLALRLGWKQDDATGFTPPAGTPNELGELSSTLGDDQSLTWAYEMQGAAANLAATSFVVAGGGVAISRGVALSLAAQPPAMHNDIYRRFPFSFDEIRIANAIPINTEYHDWKAVGGQDYWYRVNAVAGNGTGTFSDHAQ